MKKRITAMALALAMVMGTVALAAGAEKTISVTPMNMTINGQEVTPLKSDGTAAEVFAYDGATYVPLRYLSELLGIEVQWDKDSPNTAVLVSDKITVPSTGASGTFTGEGQGFGGTVTATITVEGGKITACALTGDKETPAIGGAALSALEDQVVAASSADIDGVTGATMTSNGVKEAVKAAVTAAGGTIGTTAIGSAGSDANRDETTQVVIVGAGGAGLAAAIQATDMGLDVIVLEKLGFVGGTTAMASTAYNAGGMKVQLEANPPYTADDAYRDWVGSGNDDPFLRLLSDRSGAVGDWMVGMGADLSKFNGKQVMPSDGSALGSMLVKVLSSNATSRNIDIRTLTEGKTLVTDANGKVTGVVAKDSKGEFTIYADAVILATGGFASNPEMVDTYTPTWSGYPSTASVGCTGDGITMGLALGAAIADMDNAGPQSVAYDTGNGAVSLTNVRYNGAILVNQDAVRFTTESGPSMPIARAITQQTGGYAFLVFDQTSVDNAALMQEYKEKGYFVQADTLEELAAQLGIDGAALKSTVEKYYKVFDTGVDEEFGRNNHIFSRLDKAPFYGAKISPANQTMYGGLVIDLETRVLREDGSVIEGLYAAGETTACRGSGTSIALVLGELSAETVAADLVK